MSFYTSDKLSRGLGAFGHPMRSKSDIPRHSNKSFPAVAVGILAAMVRSGLPAKRIDRLIEESFAATAPRLRQILTMYEGDSWNIHLWNPMPTSRYKLCTDLCQKVTPDWRYDPSLQADF